MYAEATQMEQIRKMEEDEQSRDSAPRHYTDMGDTSGTVVLDPLSPARSAFDLGSLPEQPESKEALWMDGVGRGSSSNVASPATSPSKRRRNLSVAWAEEVADPASSPSNLGGKQPMMLSSSSSANGASG